MTLPALADSLPAAPVRQRFVPGDITCKLAPGCPFVGPWAAYLAHAPVHPLPHPEQRVAWLDSRRSFVGASEVAAVVGANPYQGPLEVWAAKVSPRPEVPFKPRFLPGGGQVVRPNHEVGQVAEWPLLQDFARRYGCTITQPATKRHPLLPWLAATPDGDAAGGLCDGALVQVKKVGHRVDWVKDWDDGPPIYTLLQVQTEMEVWDRDLCILLVDIGELREYRIERDPEMIEPAITILADFWSYVEHATPPIDFDLRSTRSETLQHLWPEVTAPTIPASEELRRVAAAYAAAREQEKVAKEDKEGFGVQLAAMLGDHAGAAWGKNKVTRVDRAQRIDWQAYALALGGTEAGAEKYRPSPQRTLDVRIKER